MVFIYEPIKIVAIIKLTKKTHDAQKERSFWDNPGRHLPSLPQGVVDFSAGFGDGLLLGFGDDLRDALNIGGVDTESGEYLAGEVTSYAAGAARVGYAAAVKIGTRLAPSGVAANAFRNSMKGRFRLGAFRSYRSVSYPQALSRYGSDAAVRAAAGRTNIYFNTYGAGILAGGVSGN